VTELRVLQEARLHRASRAARQRKARRRRRIRNGAIVLGVVALAIVALLIVMDASASGPATPAPKRFGSHLTAKPDLPSQNPYATALAPRQLHINLKLPLKAGLLFDVRSGRVLWERNPTEELPIASLTKMMTALLVVMHTKDNAKVLITKQAIDFTGSGVGELPLGKRVSELPLLYGLLLPSGNDAAIALAQHVAGTQQRFIGMMNAQAQSMGLRCTHYTTVSGVIDQGNHSCAVDLARIAHAVLDHPLLRKIVGSSSAILPFPIKGGKLFLYNNNPLYAQNFPGTDGVKTGFTTAAGLCIVATARRGHQWLGVVLLHSGNWATQAETLLDAGFATAKN
jgi:serine-type D-Ala-D-Ala carboxypeptidase (penicillin-binding protein 5/6)